MKHVTIDYHWIGGPIEKQNQKTIEVNTDILDLLDQYDVMITKVGEEVRIFIDTAGKRFRQR